jgi:HB1, ASXL, restriction endonuclease HTH domain
LDAYLQIAESILKIERRPLSARAILAAAYRHGLVPTHLHGNTQHKTLGARISEDIITLHDESLFFRTAPGRFFLREFLTDVALWFKKSVPAREHWSPREAFS